MTWQLSCVVVCSLLAGGCTGSRPPAPPPLSHSFYASLPQWSQQPESLPRVSIAGARLAKGGLYFDVAVQAASAEEALQVGKEIALWALYESCGPDAYVQVESRGRQATLVQPLLVPRDYGGPSFLLLPSYVYPPVPAGLKMPEQRSAIQVLVVGTETQLAPGMARIRLDPSITASHPGLSVDSSWKELDLDWPTRPK